MFLRISLFPDRVFNCIFYHKAEGAGDVNIWDEERNEKTLQIDPDNKTVYAATLNQLVRTATDEIDYGFLSFYFRHFFYNCIILCVGHYFFHFKT